ncbi:MarR family winged helix-turn-helix transcriptional regulator [Corticicoccus populi]|uniref:MarR family winged helix-turn-helix transcriptional regulator n=1 Tax=Corticicoccus populi TaxID=1812821 RepID=A0ABW5WXS5_9STAP
MSSSTLFYELATIYRPFINRLDKELNAYNLFSSQWRIMKLLLDKGPHTISEIAHHNYVEKPTITRLVQKLIELEYVEAVTGEDKRVRMIQLTDSGRAVCSKVIEKIDVFYRNLLDGVDEDTQQEVTEALKKISENLKNY